MDSYLLTVVAQNYDPVARMVRGINRECLVKITTEEIQGVFGMDPTTNYREVIKFQGLEKEYLSHKDQIMQ